MRSSWLTSRATCIGWIRRLAPSRRAHRAARSASAIRRSYAGNLVLVVNDVGRISAFRATPIPGAKPLSRQRLQRARQQRQARQRPRHLGAARQRRRQPHRSRQQCLQAPSRCRHLQLQPAAPAAAAGYAPLPEDRPSSVPWRPAPATEPASLPPRAGRYAAEAPPHATGDATGDQTAAAALAADSGSNTAAAADQPQPPPT